MVKKFLVEKIKNEYFMKDIEIFENPKHISPLTNKIAWEILLKLNQKPYYSKELAKEMKIDEQKIYYYIHKLKEAELIEIIKEEKIRGGTCKYFMAKSLAFGVEIPKANAHKIKLERSFERVKEFFYEFIKNGTFNGYIVVGSPVQHGPYLTIARDGHFASQLTMFLGSICEIPKKFIIKLDTEIKSERIEKENLILIGGPVTNIISDEINKQLKIKIVWDNSWKIYSEFSKKKYTEHDYGIIAKIKNPWDNTKNIIILEGLTLEGTRGCIISVVNGFEKIFKKYEKGKNYIILIKGLDKDSDGKVDDFEIIENYVF
ncbi:MAG: S-layer protein [Candidatus Aenigmatarchaeota archaeon]